ncbi:MAG: hypothetical protein KY462_01335 [Actinobacteria bacterium]|nr:hypothetical protein [Actinomycetota bacterium]
MAQDLLERVRARNPLPEGAVAVGAGLVVLGLTSYGFLVISGRVLGPAVFAPLSALWAVVFTSGPGVFLPIEQEVARALASRRAQGVGGRPVVRRAGVVAATAAAIVLAAAVLARAPLLDALFAGEPLLLVGLGLGIVGYAWEHLLRGTLSGADRFGRYGVVLATEGMVRFGLALALAVLGVQVVGPYGVALGLPPLVAAAVAARAPRQLTADGPEAQWRELSAALGWLLSAQVLAQLLVNGPQIAAVLLAGPGEEAVAGRFISGVILARVPLFLFAAIQVALLPKLANLAGAGLHDEFRSGLWRLLAAVAGIGSLAAAGAFTVGPWALRLLFGPAYDLARADLGMLALGAAMYMLALALAQALIALDAHARVAAAWLAGVVGFTVVTAVVSELLLLRLEVGFVAGTGLALAAMGWLTVVTVRAASHRPAPQPSAGQFAAEP